MRAAATNSRREVEPQPGYRVRSSRSRHGIAPGRGGNRSRARAHDRPRERAQHQLYGAKMRDFQAGAAARRRAERRSTGAPRLRNDCLEARNKIANRRVIADPQTKLPSSAILPMRGRPRHRGRDMLHGPCGRDAFYETYPLERIFRDAHSLAGHISFSFDAQASGWAFRRARRRSQQPDALIGNRAA